MVHNREAKYWDEDIYARRQPLLYYFSNEEDGAHLVCDWNGNPLDDKEPRLGIFQKFLQNNERCGGPSETYIGSDRDDEAIIADTLIPKGIIPRLNMTESVESNDNSRLSFLTVPPPFLTATAPSHILCTSNTSKSHQKKTTKEKTKEKSQKLAAADDGLGPK